MFVANYSLSNRNHPNFSPTASCSVVPRACLRHVRDKDSGVIEDVLAMARRSGMPRCQTCQTVGLIEGRGGGTYQAPGEGMARYETAGTANPRGLYDLPVIRHR